nr:stage III sporulation protein AE [uncultured Solibaculum sp.]
MKKVLVCILFFLLTILFPFAVGATDDPSNTSDSSTVSEYDFEDQLKASGADELTDELPQETKELLRKLGIDSIGPDSLLGLTTGNVSSTLVDTVKESAKGPLKSGAAVGGIILLCALLEGFKVSFGERPLAGVFGGVAALSVGVAIVLPVLEVIQKAGEAVRASSAFMLSFIPVFAGITTAAGQPVTASLYQGLLFGVAQVVSSAANTIVVPLLSLFLAFSLVAAVVPNLNLSATAGSIQKVASWVLGLVMTVFVGILSIQGVVGNASDGVAMKAAKFFSGNFIPVVGSALGDALGAVQGCVGLLKSTVGSFGILAVVVIFVPPLLQSLIWQFILNIGAAFADLFDLKQISAMLRSTSKVLNLLIAVMLCCSLLLIISTTILLTLGVSV